MKLELIATVPLSILGRWCALALALLTDGPSYWKKVRKCCNIAESLGWVKILSHPPVWEAAGSGVKIDIAANMSATTKGPILAGYGDLKELLLIPMEDIPRELSVLNQIKPPLPQNSLKVLSSMLPPLDSFSEQFRDKYIKMPFITKRMELGI